MKMPSVMTHTFSEVPKAEIQRASFNRSHGHKTTFDAGFLVPVFVDEALPGDTFNLNMTFFARLATPIKPVMDNMHLDSFFFAVPLRLLWDNFKKFMGEQANPGDSIDFVVPQIVSPAGGHLTGSLSDYFGIPTLVAGLTHSAFWHRAYNFIWNEWFRDQNLQNSVTVLKTDGPDPTTNYTLLRRGKRHDYFTSCLPFPQRGAGVSIPLGTTANLQLTAPSGSSNWIELKNAAGTVSRQLNYQAGSVNAVFNADPGVSTNTYFATVPNLAVDLSGATAATINSLRQAFQLQRMFERDARGGTRYIELIKSHFGVTSPDARLQRPEYLGGGSSPVSIHPVPQQSVTGVTPQGNLAAFGTSSGGGHGFVKSFTEHCVIIGLVSVRADLSYQDGLNRMFSRSTKVDFYWPALSHIGEQAVLQKEIFASGVPATDNIVFGYQERYAEYRYKPSVITGKFRSNAPGTLDFWHLAQDFTVAPVLNASFIQDTPPVARVIAVPTEPHFLFDSYFKFICARPMPVYGVPGMIDHF